MFPWVVAHLPSEAKATDMRFYSPKIRNCWLSVRQINYKNKRGLLLADSSQEQFCVLLYEQYRRSIKLINLCVIRQFVHLPNGKCLYFSVHNSIQSIHSYITYISKPRQLLADCLHFMPGDCQATISWPVCAYCWPTVG